MAVPSKRTTSSKRDMRRAHHALVASTHGKCQKCGNLALSHRACSNCGFYRGREVVNVLVKLDKKERKKREKEMARKEREQPPVSPERSRGGKEDKKKEEDVKE